MEAAGIADDSAACIWRYTSPTTSTRPPAICICHVLALAVARDAASITHHHATKDESSTTATDRRPPRWKGATAPPAAPAIPRPSAPALPPVARAGHPAGT